MNFTKRKKDAALDGQSAYIWRFEDAAECAAHMRANMSEPNGSEWDRARGWYGGESPAQAAQYATSGNDALVKLAEQFLSKIEAGGIETERGEWLPSACGAYPVVGDFIAGRPDPMRRRYHVAGERAPVRVYVDSTSSGGIDAEALQQRGAALLAFVMALMQERPVELWQITSLDAKGYCQNYAALAVRAPTTPLNIGVCAHLLTSQAWVRGIGYGWLMQEAKSGGGWGWGRPPMNPKDKARYERLSREALRMEPQDVFVDAIVLDDPLTDRPVEWINERLAAVRAAAAEAA